MSGRLRQLTAVMTRKAGTNGGVSNGKHKSAGSKKASGGSGLRIAALMVVGFAVLVGALLAQAPGNGTVPVRGLLWTSVEAILPRVVFGPFLCLVTALAALMPVRPSVSLPDESIPPYHSLEPIWNDAEMLALDNLIAGIGKFPSLTADQTSKHEHTGEGVPLNADGSCPHLMLIPNRSRTLCVLATRLDVGVHYLQSGGPSGLKESQDALLARTLSFSKFFITNPVGTLQQNKTTATPSAAADQGLEALNLPALKSLFSSAGYLAAAKDICDGLTVLDPFQLGVIMQLPGQQLGVHVDVPWFRGANRFHFPQWLLVVMAGSGLWADRNVRQVQGVAYLHAWDRLAGESDSAFATRNGGDFLYWPTVRHGSNGGGNSSVPLAHPPRRNSGIMLDGSLLAHGTAMFRPAERDSLPIASLRRNSTSQLRFEANPTAPANSGTVHGSWLLEVDGSLVRRYSPEQVRTSLVWRAMCFATEADKAAYHSADPKINPPLELGAVLSELKRDLIKRSKLTPATAETIDPLEFAQLLLATYVDYPWPAQRMPFNYCIIPGAVGEAIRKVAC